jgi:hypothetical protein
VLGRPGLQEGVEGLNVGGGEGVYVVLELLLAHVGLRLLGGQRALQQTIHKYSVKDEMEKEEDLNNLNGVFVERLSVSNPARLPTRRCRIAIAMIFFGSPVLDAIEQLSLEENYFVGEDWKILTIGFGSGAVEMIREALSFITERVGQGIESVDERLIHGLYFFFHCSHSPLGFTNGSVTKLLLLGSFHLLLQPFYATLKFGDNRLHRGIVRAGDFGN